MAARRNKTALAVFSLLTALPVGSVLAQTAPALPPANSMPISATAPQVGAVNATAALDSAAGGPQPTFRFVPSVELSERYSDNAALAPSATAKGDWMTDATLGLNIDYRAARLKAQVDYQLSRLFHNDGTSLDNTQHFLNSSATLEAVEKWLFIDGRASITQQNRSAFGVTNIADVPNVSANRIETTTYQLSPYVRGSLGNVATYQLRINEARTRTNETTFPETKTREWTGFIKNAPSSGWLGWSVDGNSLIVDNSAVNRQEDSRIRGSLTFEVDPQFHLSASGGRETSDLDSAQKKTTTNYGFGVEWSPSPRTQFAAVTQKRFFGNDHLVVFSHRTPLTEWRFASSREVAISTNDLASSSGVSVNNLLLDLLASSIPDPAARAEASKQRFMQTGIPEASGIQDSFLTVRPFLNRRQQASVALIGLRNTITIDIGYREQRAFDGLIVPIPGVAPLEQIRQLNFNATWAYRLSPVSTLRLNVSHLRTEGLDTDLRSSTQRLQSLFFVTQLGRRTSVSLGVQRIAFDSTVFTGYRENAFVSTLSVRF